MNETHDPGLRSWIESANAAEADFPLQNLPFGLFTAPLNPHRPHLGIAIGDQVLDLFAAAQGGYLAALPASLRGACQAPVLNPFFELGPDAVRLLRQALVAQLRAEAGTARAIAACLLPLETCILLLPAAVGDYTDFYASIDHAANVGGLFRPENPLLPNYKYVPVGYHGRSSSLVASGAAVRRPQGQRPAANAEGVPPDFGPTRQLDYELEVAFWVGTGNALGDPVPLATAESHLFGLSLLNDWSARDLQRWEYQPLGPFLGKSFATTVGAWVVTLEALAPFRSPRRPRPEGDPAPLPYLEHPADRERGAFDLELEVWCSSRAMREQGIEAVRLSQSNLRDLYWTPGQMVAHHTSNGCNLREGDLLGSGTVSGPAPTARGCLLELTRRGAEPLTLPTGETRAFLHDGDEIALRGYCQRPGFRRIGFGECRGIVQPAS